MFFAYVLQSTVAKRRYIGSSADVVQREGQHNAGLCKSTRPWRPWKVVHQEAFESRAEAMRRERYLKTGRGREELERILHTGSSSVG